MSAPVHIYELWIGGELLYVGCSPRPKSRLNGHRIGWKFMEAAELRIVATFDDRVEALSAEAERIGRLAPPFNVNWHPDCDETPEGRRARSAVVKADKLRREKEYWDAITERNRVFMDDINRELEREEAEKVARQGATGK